MSIDRLYSEDDTAPFAKLQEHRKNKPFTTKIQMTTEDYLKLNRRFKSQVLGIRGNMDNKRQLEEIQRANGFTSIGQTLDYVLTVFTYIADGSAFREHEQKLKGEIYKLQNDNNEKTGVIKTLTNRIAELEQEKQNSTFFNAETQSQFDHLKTQAEKLLERRISNSEFMHMLVDFATNDPGEHLLNLLEKHEVAILEIVEAANDLSFPLKTTIEILYPDLFTSNNNNNAGGKTEAGTDTGATANNQ